MLVNKTYKQNDIITVALLTGQELIAKFVSEDDGSIVIKKPLTLVFGPEGAAFQPYTITGDSDNEVTIRMHTVISVLKTKGEIATAYSGATSGLVVPEKQGLIL